MELQIDRTSEGQIRVSGEGALDSKSMTISPKMSKESAD